jgi:hypothetical protein
LVRKYEINNNGSSKGKPRETLLLTKCKAKIQLEIAVTELSEMNSCPSYVLSAGHAVA